MLDSSGREHDFDRVVLATHADEALACWPTPPSDEFDVLGAFDYSANTTQLHRDDSRAAAPTPGARQLELPARVAARSSPTRSR